MRKFLTWTLILSIAAVGLVLSATRVFYLYARQQGAPPSHWETFKTAKVVFDQKGIPTLTADHWQDLIEAQGYVVASERMWQMDLMRRKAAGHLSEWFGSTALELDTRRRLEDWPGVLKSASTSLPVDERWVCETYAKGVNRFIEDFEGSWGIEYRLLGVRPEPWSCRDSLAVVLLMSETLTSYVSREAKQHRWRSHLSRDWEAFLFPRDHPWNRPLFNDSQARPMTELPLPSEFIDSTQGEKRGFNKLLEHMPIGSNSWAARDENHHYLANDPHLAYSVPMIWYAMRLRISPQEWVVGTALPGIPGIIIGMNPHYAWAFTTTNEDVDDLSEEKIDPDKNTYLARENEWRPITEKEFVIEVKDRDPEVVKARSTHRGPLIEVEDLPGRLFSRQWLPLKPGMLRLPVIKLNRARDWQSFNAAIDQMKNPAQNVTYVDRKGNIGIRISGTGIIRKNSGRFIHQGEKGEWLGFEDHATRRRAFYAAKAPVKFALPITNQRMWSDEWGHHWGEDSRNARLIEVLKESEEYTLEAMIRLQGDTRVRYLKMVLDWLAKELPTDRQAYRDTITRWESWNGDARTDEKSYSEALLVDEWLTELCLEQVRKRFLPHEPSTTYWHPLRRVWLMRVMKEKNGLKVFGLKNKEVAEFLADRLFARKKSAPYPLANRWQVQHPFVGRVPIIDRLFAITEYPQWGNYLTVRNEGPTHGSSARLIWDVKNPGESVWNFPVGQSGHIASPHYRDMQDDFFHFKPMKVFDDRHEWTF